MKVVKNIWQLHGACPVEEMQVFSFHTYIYGAKPELLVLPATNVITLIQIKLSGMLTYLERYDNWLGSTASTD